MHLNVLRNSQRLLLVNFSGLLFQYNVANLFFTREVFTNKTNWYFPKKIPLLPCTVKSTKTYKYKQNRLLPDTLRDATLEEKHKRQNIKFNDAKKIKIKKIIDSAMWAMALERPKACNKMG